MTELDTTIFVMSAFLVLVSIGVGRGIGLALIVFLGFSVNEWTITHLNIDTWDAFYVTGAEWMAMVVAVDLFIVGLLAFRRRKSEVWLMIIFGVSAIFHLFCRLEFLGQDAMPMYDMRFNFVKIIAALQLTGVILNLIGGGWSGGKLVKLSFNRVNFFSRRVSSTKALKVIK